MAYQYPLNGGRINASIGGNSTSAGAGYSLISTGTMILAGGNNITLSQNGNAVTISGAASGGAGGGVALNDGVNAISSGTARLSVTGALTASINGQTLNLGVPSQSSLVGTGIINVSRTGSTISIGAAAFSAGMSTNGNTSGVVGLASNQLIFAGGNNVTLNQVTATNGNIITISAGTTASAPTNLMQSAPAAGVTGSASLYTASSNVMPNPTVAIDSTTAAEGTTSLLVTNLSNGYPTVFINNGVANGAPITGGQQYTATVSVKRGIGSTAQCRAQISFYTSSGSYIANTQSGPISVNSTTFTLLTVTATAPSNAAYAIPQWLSYSSVPTNDTFYLDQWGIFDSSYVSGWSLPGAVVTGGGGGGVAIANSQTTYTSGTANLNVAGGAMTISSATGQSFNFSVPQTSLFSGTGAISISTNGNTISIGAPAMFDAGISNMGNTSGVSGQNTNGLVLVGGNNITLSQSTNTYGATITISGGGGGGGALSYFNPQDGYAQTVGQQGQGTLHIQPMQAPGVVYDRVAIPVYFTGSTNTTASVSISNWVGIYSRSGSSLSLFTSYSTSNSIIHSGAVNSLSNVGIKLITISNDGDSLSGGQYWVGNIFRTSVNGANISLSQLLVSQQNSNFSGIWGVPMNATNQYTRGLGVYSVSTTGMPSSVAFSQINGTASLVLRQPIFYLLSGTV